MPRFFADVLNAAKLTLQDVFPPDSVKLTKTKLDQFPLSPAVSTPAYLISPGPVFTWAQGEQFDGESTFILDGEVIVSIWQRNDMDEPSLFDNLADDSFLGEDALPVRVIEALQGRDEDIIAEADKNNFWLELFERPVFRNIEFISDSPGIPTYRGVHITFACKFQMDL